METSQPFLGIISGPRRRSHAEVAHRSQRIAGGLHRLGVRQGDSVCILMRNDIAFIEAAHAAMRLGAYGVPINWHFKAAEVRHILGDSQAKMLVVHADLLGQISDAVPEDVRVFVVEPHAHTRRAYGLTGPWPSSGRSVEDWESFRDEASGPAAEQQVPGSAMVYTSGTTGLPKGIRRQPPTVEQLALLAERSRVALGIGPGMRALVSAPLYHSAPAAYAVQAAARMSAMSDPHAAHDGHDQADDRLGPIDFTMWSVGLLGVARFKRGEAITARGM